MRIVYKLANTECVLCVCVCVLRILCMNWMSWNVRLKLVVVAIIVNITSIDQKVTAKCSRTTQPPDKTHRIAGKMKSLILLVFFFILPLCIIPKKKSYPNRFNIITFVCMFGIKYCVYPYTLSCIIIIWYRYTHAPRILLICNFVRQVRAKYLPTRLSDNNNWWFLGFLICIHSIRFVTRYAVNFLFRILNEIINVASGTNLCLFFFVLVLLFYALDHFCVLSYVLLFYMIFNSSDFIMLLTLQMKNSRRRLFCPFIKMV